MRAPVITTLTNENFENKFDREARDPNLRYIPERASNTVLLIRYAETDGKFQNYKMRRSF